MAMLHRFDFDAGSVAMLPPVWRSLRARSRHIADVRLREAKLSGLESADFIRAAKRADLMAAGDVNERGFQLLFEEAGGSGVLDGESVVAVLTVLHGDDRERFVHPAHRALLIHASAIKRQLFHERTQALALILVQWHMRRKGYVLFDHLEILRMGGVPGGEDAASLLAWLKLIHRAREAFLDECGSGGEASGLPEALIHAMRRYNTRQRQLLVSLLEQPDVEYVIEEYQAARHVAYATARADLYELRDAGLLTAKKRGKSWIFRATIDLRDRLANRGAPYLRPALPEEPGSADWRVW